MYPYRCEACGSKFYRRVASGKGLGEGRYPMTADSSTDQPEEIPRLVQPPETMGSPLSNDEFVDFIGQISRAEQRKGQKGPRDEE